MTAFVVTLALILDYFFSELPNRIHPLVGFGKLAQHLERDWNLSTNVDAYRFWMGLAALILLVFIPVLVLIFLLFILPLWANILLQALILWFCIGWQSLIAHAQAIAFLLSEHNLIAAREALGFIVSRDTEQLSEQKIAAATIESVLENGNDAIFASLFWFVVGGAPAALAHRLVNTLDAMWGYRNDRFEYFGKAAARLDDGLNYIPARLTALSYALFAHQSKTALSCWQRQAKKHDSPNAGVVMATGAAALNLRLGGRAIYHGKQEKRPVFGFGKKPVQEDIKYTLRLIHKSLILWFVVIMALS